MTMFRFLEPFFHALSDGKIIRVTVAWVLRVAAVIGALAGVFWFIAFVAIGFKGYTSEFGNHSPGVLIGSILFALFGICLGYLWAGICAFRARSVLEMGDSHFTVVSILSILFRLNGELMFVTYSLLGVGGCVFIWFTNFSPLSELGSLGGRLPFSESASSGFLGGIEFGILMLFVAFVAIVVSYALAELTIVLVEIALNTRGIAAIAGGASASPAPIPRSPAPRPSFAADSSAARSAPAGWQPACKKCGAILETGSAFCAECGSTTGEEWQANSAGNVVMK